MKQTLWNDMNPIPVLMYHHVNPHKGDMFTVTPEVFEGQMAYLAKAGYRALSLDELFAFIKGDLDLKQKAVVITFDDGWLDNFIYAFPVLEKYKLRATMFIVTDWVEKSSEKFDGIATFIPTNEESKALVRKGEAQKVVLTWELIGKMTDSGLFDFFSHTKRHLFCNQLSEPELLAELRESKRILEERLGRPCPYLCWPDGMYSDTAISIARKTGYKALFTIERGAVKAGSDPFGIKRNLVEDNVSRFRQRMQIYTHSVLSELHELYLRIKRR
jgi:peptidoglycan/xylan/chitin deacetylase (PgdA/CDA1 family)